jgi:hypothetical protein
VIIERIGLIGRSHQLGVVAVHSARKPGQAVEDLASVGGPP